jgi:hypothetical protein
MVCIMLILVLMAGSRVRKAPVDVALSPAGQRSLAELSGRQSVETSLQNDVRDVAGQIETIERQAQEWAIRRQTLSNLATDLNHAITEHREKLSVDEREQLDLLRGLHEARRQRAEVDQRKAQIVAAKAAPTVLKAYPTPLSKTVDEKEVMFQIRNGRICFVPMDALVKRAAENYRKYERGGDAIKEVGPYRGFKMIYSVEINPNALSPTSARQGEAPVRFACEMRPLSPDQGETVDQALERDSDFRRELESYRRQRCTVTIFVYPESFAQYRRIREELHRMNLDVAAWPMGQGEPIRGSSDGSKSAAQ